jgi:CheY-like chemotaxis protein
LTVRDTGCGMTPEIRSRVFEPFFTTKEVGKGTGLGLATVYGIVKQSDGHIEVDSEPGRGTTFKVYLPRLAASGSGDSGPGLTTAPRGSETVLVVEDEDLVRGFTSMALRSSGYTVLTARDGEDALRVVGEHAGTIHLLVTDVVMPRMGGRQLSQRLRLAHPQAKVLFVSGYTDDAVMRHGIQQSESNFLHKPFSAALLTRKVREILDKNI